MTYQEEYNVLIERAKLTTPQHKGYGIERHHIVPRCMGGTDDDSNLVFLTYEQHINAHILLWKAHPTNGKLAGAVCAMLDLTGTTSKSASARLKKWESLPNNKMYDYICALSSARAEKNLPWNNSSFGKNIINILPWLSLDIMGDVIGELGHKDLTLGVIRDTLFSDDGMKKTHINEWWTNGWAYRFINHNRLFICSEVYDAYNLYGKDVIKQRVVSKILEKSMPELNYRIDDEHLVLYDRIIECMLGGDVHSLYTLHKTLEFKRKPNGMTQDDYFYVALGAVISSKISRNGTRGCYAFNNKRFRLNNKLLSMLLSFAEVQSDGPIAKVKRYQYASVNEMKEFRKYIKRHENINQFVVNVLENRKLILLYMQYNCENLDQPHYYNQ